jgi:hypothetical protein
MRRESALHRPHRGRSVVDEAAVWPEESSMISAKVIELIENHAPRLSENITEELMSSDRTPAFRNVKRQDLETRIFELLQHLGDWIGDPRGARVGAEFEDWGRRRFGQGIPLSEIVYAVIILKRQLRRYIRDHGLIDTWFPRVEGDYVLPMHLQSLQDLNYAVGTFFDEALYHLARGYESATVH